MLPFYPITGREDKSYWLLSRKNCATQDKQREETELVETAHLFGSTLAIWFRDQSDEEQAAQVDLSPSAWRRLRSQQLLEKARLVLDIGRAVLDGAKADEAADYGITAAEVERFSQEIDDYAAVIAAPQQGIAQRKALTRQLAQLFSEAAGYFEMLDKLILHFGRTPEGRALVAAYQASRVIRDLGRRPARRTQGEPELVGAAE